MTVSGHAGSVVVGGDFFTRLTVYQDGLDQIYVGGNFGSLIYDSQVNMALGSDVAFAHVAGEIWSNGLQVPTITSTGTTAFADDGGATFTIRVKDTVDDIGFFETTPTYQFRYLPVGRPGGGPLGAVLTEIASNDALEITTQGGSADIPYVRFDPFLVPGPFTGLPSFSLELDTNDPLGELDVWMVESQGGLGALNRVENNTFQGDIVNVFAGSVGDIWANGHVGITERYMPELGRFQNPTPTAFAPHTLLGATPDPAAPIFQADPSLAYIYAGASLFYATEDTTYVTQLSADSLRYWNGVAVSAGIGSVGANGSIGDVYAGTFIGSVEADMNGVDNGGAFTFKGHMIPARTSDGLAGTVYAGLGIGEADPGDGILGSHGGTPDGGIFTDGILDEFYSSNALVMGPIFGANGINSMQGTDTIFDEASIGAGADTSDWTFWDEAILTTPGVELDEFEFDGVSGIRYSRFQVGVIGDLVLGPQAVGIEHTNFLAVGDPLSGRGIDLIEIGRGDFDGTEAPPFYLQSGIRSQGRIGDILVRNGNMINLNIFGLASIGEISISDDLIATQPTTISAPLFIELIEADNFTGGSTLQLATGRVFGIHTRWDMNADLNVDGTLENVMVDGDYLGDLIMWGPSGHLGYLGVGQQLFGQVTIANYIGQIEVFGGHVFGDIQAGGSTPNNLAIGSIQIWNGDLFGDVDTIVNTATQRPGGGLGELIVEDGTVFGDVTTTSYFDFSRGNPVTAHIGLIEVMDGNIEGDITIQQNNPLDPFDPGGTLFELFVENGNVNGDVLIEQGDIVDFEIENGVLNGDVTVLGSDVYSMVIEGNGAWAVNSNIYVEGSLFLFEATDGFVAGSLTVEDVLAEFYTEYQLQAPVWAGYIGEMELQGGSSAAGTVTSMDDLLEFQSEADVSGDVTVGDDMEEFYIRYGNLDADLTVNGNVPDFRIKGGRITSNSDALDPRVEIDGNVEDFRVDKYGGPVANVIDDDIYIGDMLVKFKVSDGDFNGSLEAGYIGKAEYKTPNGVMGAITSHTELESLKVKYGPIDAPINVARHAGKIDAQGGVTPSGDISIGWGLPGDGLDQLKVKNGPFMGDLSIDGNFLKGKIKGSVINSDIDISNILGKLKIKGNYTDSNIDANQIVQIKVSGAVSSTGAPAEEIHAAFGSFVLKADGDKYFIDDLVGEVINGIHAYVG